MVFQTKTYASLVSVLPKSISDKRAAKKRKSLAKIVFLDVGTTVRHTFPSSELQCLPRGDPKNLCVNTRIRLLATHSLLVLVEKFIYLLELMRMKMSKILLSIM